MILQCVIIDDEPLARKGLREYMQDVEFLRLAGEFDNPVKAIDTILQEKVDLLFLDIQMPKMTGVDFLKTMPHSPMTIFTTAYPQYAVEGFELNAIDYLVKPFSFDRFCRAVMKARKMKESDVPPSRQDQPPQPDQPARQDHFYIKSDGRLVRIPFDDILFVEALQNYIALHTVEKKYITYLTFHAIEEYLPADRFVRTHKSFIVAAGKIESIEGNEIRIGPHRIPISRTERDAVMQQLLQNRLPKRGTVFFVTSLKLTIMRRLLLLSAIMLTAFFSFAWQGPRLAQSLQGPRLVHTLQDPRLGHASREDKAGWIYVHLEGKPADIGYQHGWLLAAEIDDLLQTMKYFLAHSSGKDWNFYRAAAKNMFWKKIDPEYQEEIAGIVEGLKARGKKYDVYDLVALNGNIELAQYYVPMLAERKKPGSANNKAPGNCSGFIATGSYTADGKIAIGHNNWTDYILGERWNVIADIVPEKGNRLFMDMMPGLIHSGDDFVVTGGGMLITETTITQFKGFDESGIPEFVRARKAAQYANSIDDFVRIMTGGNNGGYANDWLVGDTKTNEIARLELGLKNYRVWRTKDGIYTGSNFASDQKLIAEETTFDPSDSTSSPNSRRRRWETLTEDYKGKIDANTARMIEGDSYNELTRAKEASRCVIAGRVDTDPKGCPEWGWAPFYPGGTVQGKITTAELAKDLKFWAHMGNPSGEDFLVAPFLKLHPQYEWQATHLHDMPSHPWTLFEAKKN